MKAFFKIIWLVLSVYLLKYITGWLTTERVNSFADKLNTPLGIDLKKTFNIDFVKIYNAQFVTQVVFFIILFLGLDLISGEFKGLIKGPLKIVFNTILYLIGFSILFFVYKSFAISII